MTVSNEMLYAAAAGAAVALLAVRYLGYLTLPTDAAGKGAKPPQPTVVYVKGNPESDGQPVSQAPSYKATFTVPHEITITPQVPK